MKKKKFTKEFEKQVKQHLEELHKLIVENNVDHLSMCVFPDYYGAFHYNEDLGKTDFDISKCYTTEEEVDD